jgi:GNAT superfamily N-acetyltransferase
MSDVADVARLTMELGYDADAASVARRLSRLLSRRDQQFFVADSEDHVVGWVHVFISEYVELDPFVVIGGLVVDRAYRRRGIGRLLLLLLPGANIVAIVLEARTIVSDPQGQRLGDRLAHTQVIEGAGARDLVKSFQDWLLSLASGLAEASGRRRRRVPGRIDRAA